LAFGVTVQPASDTFVRHTVAEQIAPLVQLYTELAARWLPAVDPDAAAARVRAGRVAYEPADVIASAGSLLVPFVRATVALERAGLATDDDATQARERRLHLPGLVRAWLAAEPMPRDRIRATARRAAALVASSVLRQASEQVQGTGAVESWSRTYCPCCGGSPDFSLRAESGGRTLICARCDTAWHTAALGCLGCGERDAPTIARIDADPLRYNLAICNACGRYLKEPLDARSIDPVVERVLTAQLDAAAEARGLRL
jgi:hypothetical protein